MKPIFGIPYIKPPTLYTTVSTEILNELECRIIPCHPEAPWIKRCGTGIKFTDEIQYLENENIFIDSHTSKNNSNTSSIDKVKNTQVLAEILGEDKGAKIEFFSEKILRQLPFEIDL